MNVLSLFDGIACGRIALQRAGIEVENYYASEVDKHAIEVAKSNWPEIQHVGDVRNLTYFNGRLWRGRWVAGIDAVSLNIDDAELIHDGHIDLVIGGSPCQSFSQSGKMKGFEDPRGQLFWHYVRLWRQIRAENPKAKFLLENVKMKKEWVKVITEALGVEPIEINSALVSAQNRKRLYWTNIEGVEQPEDKGIVLKDIVEDNLVYAACAIRGRYDNEGKINQRLEVSDRVKCNSLTTVQKDALIYFWVSGVDQCFYYSDKMVKGFNRRLERNSMKGNGFSHAIPGQYSKSATLTSRYYKDGKECIISDVIGWRKLTPLECERLQTVPDNYTAGASNTQRYKMIGNGWTVDVIAHILKCLKP